MTPLPPDLAPPAAGVDSLASLLAQGGPFVLLSLLVSVALVMIALERGLRVLRFRAAVRRVDASPMEAARRGALDEARKAADALPWPVRDIFVFGLDRALGAVRGDAAAAMRREHRRAMDDLKSYVWMLGSAASLMPFVGLLGTVVGIMESFAAIGSSGSGGFGVVSAGLSEALIATAAGLAVALEAVVFFNVLQNAMGRAGRELGLLVDELSEILSTEAGDARLGG